MEYKLLLIVGSSRTGKSTLASHILKEVCPEEKAIVFLADKLTRTVYSNVSYGRSATIEKGEKIEEWCNRNMGRWVVIEDITVKFNEKIKETLRYLLTRRRVNLILITQNMRKMASFIKEPRYAIFFNTADLTNLRTITRTNEKMVAEKIHDLKKHQFMVVDTNRQTMSSVFNGKAKVVVEASEQGVKGESYAMQEKASEIRGRPIENKSFRQKVFELFEKGLDAKEVCEKLGYEPSSYNYQKVYSYWARWKRRQRDV